MGKEHFVQQGECLSSLAKNYGFVNYETIYNHPNNSELKAKRRNPNILFPDDVVYIPDNELEEVEAVTEQKHRFQLIGNKTLFRLVVKDGDEKPFANVRYELKIEKQTITGMTGNDGKLEQMIPADARTGGIILYADENNETKAISAFSLKFGYLDPVEEISGIQSRLNNLGFSCGKVDGIFGIKTKEALHSFQEKNGLTANGEPDLATREKLRQIHDWA